MRRFMAILRAAMARMREAISHAALVAVRGVDGVLTWTWEVVRRVGAGVTAPVDYEPVEEEIDVPRPATNEDLDERMLEAAGSQAVRAAQAVVRGNPVPPDVEPVIAAYVRNLSRDDQWVMAGADPVVVGRHMAGLEDLKSPEGFVLRRPEPEADRERDEARKRKTEKEFERRQVAQAEHVAVKRRHNAERVEWEAAMVSPTFTFTPAGF